MPKPAGVTFNRYAAIAGRVLRRALKEDVRIQASAKDEFDLRFQKWENGKAGPAKHLEVPLQK